MKCRKDTLSILLLSVWICVGLISTGQAQAAGEIIGPRKGARIENRLSFPVTWSIDSYAQDRATRWHYWISLANGDATQHWPKFYIKSGHGSGNVHDGGQNPLPTPQPMTILLLKVGDGVNQDYVAWLEKGLKSNVWEGLPVNNSQIVDRVPIEFP